VAPSPNKNTTNPESLPKGFDLPSFERVAITGFPDHGAVVDGGKHAQKE